MQKDKVQNDIIKISLIKENNNLDSSNELEQEDDANLCVEKATLKTWESELCYLVFKKTCKLFFKLINFKKWVEAYIK